LLLSLLPTHKPTNRVISTEATDSLIVRCAVEKPALSEVEWDPRISLCLVVVSILAVAEGLDYDLLCNLTLRLIRRILNLRLKPLQQPFQKRPRLNRFILQLMRMRHMPGQISQHDPPRKRILPRPAPNAHMLPLLRNPDPQNLKRSLIPLRSRWNTQNLLDTHLGLLGEHNKVTSPLNRITSAKVKSHQRLVFHGINRHPQNPQ
jgi:hypothetical protein